MMRIEEVLDGQRLRQRCFRERLSRNADVLRGRSDAIVNPFMPATHDRGINEPIGIPPDLSLPLLQFRGLVLSHVVGTRERWGQRGLRFSTTKLSGENSK